MYELTVKGEKFTIPKENIRFLAMTKAMDLNVSVELSTNEQAIEFLNKLGVEVKNYENIRTNKKNDD